MQCASLTKAQANNNSYKPSAMLLAVFCSILYLECWVYLVSLCSLLRTSTTKNKFKIFRSMMKLICLTTPIGQQLYNKQHNLHAQQLTKSSTYKLINSKNHKLINLQDHKLTNSSTKKLKSSNKHQLTNSSTQKLTNLPTHQPFSIAM